MHIEFPNHLPINNRRDEIAHLIKEHQVIIVAGETGSGKTTQLPKLCLSLGLAEKGMIGHTQPRRLAARTVADRIASELKVSLGSEVGYQVRFKDHSSDQTQLKLMTDGILLTEMQHDRLLKKYSTIIIDEAHERSLNIDFLLGLLKNLCRRRPELKVIITSATIDLEKFANHFSTRLNGEETPAPIIEISGRTYPVETIYRPLNENEALPDAICDTVKHIARAEAKGTYRANGDVLVFCAGEREIRDAAQALRRAQLPVEVMPLYSRLSVSEQNRVFKPAHRRKIVLATNVAETSITVPGIAYVIDPGLARVSRYSFRSKVQRLPIERISQASANQRLGRCGRVSNGVCIRLYSEEDFEQRPEFTQAEILRSNLASVLLKMMRLGIKDVSQFNFIDQPDARLLKDGFKLLSELQAIESHKGKNNKQPRQRLTAVGRQMSDLPIDPRFARILIAAKELDCLRDALVLISVLSIQDPRERPAEYQQQADQKHQELAHPQSDFFGFLYLWQCVNDHRQALSNAQFKQLCIKNYWSIARIFEWRELLRQLAQMCKTLGWSVDAWQAISLPESSPNKEQKKPRNNTKQSRGFDPRYAKLHQALLYGMADNIATKNVDGEYLATRGRLVHLFPSSSQFKRKPAWFVAGEYLETSRVFAINVAEINPQWVISSSRHLLRYSYSSPYYHIRSGVIKTSRKTLFQGLTLNDKESVNYAPLNPTESRAIFIQEALVAGKYQPRANKAAFVAHNAQLIATIEDIEAKTRRRNLLITDEKLYELYDERLPDSICSRMSLEKWLDGGHQDTLKFSKNQLLAAEIDESDVAQFPNQILVNEKPVAIHYSFNPGQPDDGVTTIIPISVLAPFPEHVGSWLVPGLLRDKCIALIKTLPKAIRRHYAPASDTIDRVLPKLKQVEQTKPLTEVLAEVLYRTRGTKVAAQDFDTSKLDPFYRMNYRVMDVDGSLVEEGRDLTRLKSEYAHKVHKSVHAAKAIERQRLEIEDIRDWNFGDVESVVEYPHQGMTVQAFQALRVDEDGTVQLKIFDNSDLARYHHGRGVLALAKQTLAANHQHKKTLKYLRKELMRAKPNRAQNDFSQNKNKGLSQLATQLKQVTPTPSPREAWVDELIDSALSQVCFEQMPADVRRQAAFENALTRAKNWVSLATQLESALITALKLRDALLQRMHQNPAQCIDTDTAHEDIKAQLYRLFDPVFLRYTSHAQLQQYPRYLKAIDARLEKLKVKFSSPEESVLQTFQARYSGVLDQKNQDHLGADFALGLDPSLRQFGILLEEWRVSIYAQQLRTQQPVSAKRLQSYWNTELSKYGELK